MFRRRCSPLFATTGGPRLKQNQTFGFALLDSNRKSPREQTTDRINKAVIEALSSGGLRRDFA